MNAIPWWIWLIGGLFLAAVPLTLLYAICKSGAWADEQMDRQFYEMEEQEVIPFYVEEVEYDNEYRNVVVSAR